jgi:chromosome segregation ATPase
VVAASEKGLYHYLKARFDADAGAQVILDRRRRGHVRVGPGDRQVAERRRSHSEEILSSRRVAVVRLTAAAEEDRVVVNEPAGTGGTASMEGIEGLEDRQRVDRWLEESQYLVGRIVPAYLDDRDRVRARLEVVEQDNERLRTELGEARREITELRGDLDFHRTERANVADSFGAIVEHLAALQKPINDVSRRLHGVTSVTAEVKV